MLFYSPYISPRLRYIAGFIGAELFDGPEPFQFTSDRAEFVQSPLPKLNYSQEDLPDGAFHVGSTSLLSETGIAAQDIQCFEAFGHKAFFPVNGDFPFDIFAASFYLISRYEEYLPHKRDEFGRYSHSESLAFRQGFLHQPLVNNWILELRKALAAKFPSLIFRYPNFKFIPSYDIDIAWSYLHKGWLRNGYGLTRALLRGKWQSVRDRVAVLRGKRHDPYDAYEWLDSLHLYCRLKAYYFFLAAQRLRGVDNNISTRLPALQELVRYHASGYRVGIHPSWQSGEDKAILKEELEWMEWVTDQPITRSRQHYIRFRLPETYRNLVCMGIEQDYSMGYGSINGFRASVASSFYWYDLEKEETTGLRIFPFCFMDANSRYEQGHTPAQARTELMQLYHQIRRVNGLMITIWHNSFLGTDPEFAGWREIYEVFLKQEIFWDA